MSQYGAVFPSCPLGSIMNKPTCTRFAWLLVVPLLLAGCADERAAVTPQPKAYPLAPYGVPLARTAIAPHQG